MSEPHVVPMMFSVCVGTQGCHWVLLCMSVEGTGCVRGLGGWERPGVGMRMSQHVTTWRLEANG